MNLNFTTPNPYTLTAIDGYMQEKGGALEKAWDRTPANTLYQGPGDGYGWEGIAEARPHDLVTAFYAALSFMSQHGITQDDIHAYNTF